MTCRLAFILMLLPAVAVAQSPGDTVEVVVPADKNCSDFVSQQDAQGWYDAVEIITGQPDAHGLDSDGDGQPCEGIEVAKRETLADSVWVDYRLEAQEVRCVTGRSFTFEELIAQAKTAMTDSIPYRGPEGVWPRWECVHTISQLKSQ